MQEVQGAPAGYVAAQRDFEQSLTVDQRITLQIFLIAAGYTNAVPTERFNSRIFKALQSFQSDNGFIPDGLLDKAQVNRLLAAGSVKLNLWGFRKVDFPGRPISIWAPVGLGLNVMQNASGLHFRDPSQQRLELDLVSVPNRSVRDVYNGMLADKQRDGATIHYMVFKDNWFVISTTTSDGADHYYRYHQDDDNVTGFALEWNNANGNINAERIAVIMSGSLWSAMTGAPFVDPPHTESEAKVDTKPQPVTAPASPAPSPPSEKKRVSTGTGFFVTDDGAFVTNAHVVDGCTSIAVKMDDSSVHDALRIATDSQNDLALLKVAAVPARVVSLRIGARLGESVEAFGFPHTEVLATSGNFTLGNITATSGMGDDSRYLQMSAPVQAGNSGGPLLDSGGNLVGVVSAKLDALKVAMKDGDLPQNVNFAVKSSIVATFLDANRVEYKVGNVPEKPMEPADIAERARQVSGFVVCR